MTCPMAQALWQWWAVLLPLPKKPGAESKRAKLTYDYTESGHTSIEVFASHSYGFLRNGN